jgi:hypothetical protein
MQEAREVLHCSPLFARAEPDDEYDFPKPEPLDPWASDQGDEKFEREEEYEEDEEE